MQLSNDREIRSALHHKKLRHLHACPNTIVVDELGLAHAKARVDVAVIDGCLHGFEIKSALDTLDRLPNQLKLYQECLGKLTIVCDSKHLPAVYEIVPAWSGIIEVTKGPRGAIDFRTIRRPQRNQHVQAEKLAHLLWRAEAVELLMRLNVSAPVLKQPRKHLYQILATLLTVEQLTAFIRDFMKVRENWRGLPALG